MKPLNALGTFALAAYAAVALSACGKTSNSTAASTPATSTCTAAADGTLRDQNGRLCSTATGTSTCPAAGYYTNSYGQTVQCVPGQAINNGAPTGYPYPTNPTQNTDGCSYWTQYYQTPYVPMILNGQYMCVNYNYINGYAAGSSYYNNYDYYYQYPPYSSSGGSSCDKSVAISYGSFSGAVCF